MTKLNINLSEVKSPVSRRAVSSYEWFIFHAVTNSRNILPYVKANSVNDAVMTVVSTELKRLSAEDRKNTSAIDASIQAITQILTDGVDIASTTDVTNYIDSLE